MKQWIVLIIVGCLGSVTALDMALANPSPDKRRNLNYVYALTQNSTLKLDQVWELIENARASAKVNQPDQATRLLSQAFELAQSAILAAYVQRHEYESALGFVQGIPNTDNQDSIARSLAEAAWRSGRYDIALESSQVITNLSLKVTTLINLAQALVAVGQQEKAASIVFQAFELSQQSDELLLFDWVKDFLSTGQETQVNAILNSLTEGNDNQLAYNRFLVTNAYLSQGRYREAFKYAQRIPDRVLLPLAEYKDPKVELFESIIQQALEAGHYDFAQEVALTLTNQEDQVATLQIIARHVAEMGQTQPSFDSCKYHSR